jgi:hypothetical protein
MLALVMAGLVVVIMTGVAIVIISDPQDLRRPGLARLARQHFSL